MVQPVDSLFGVNECAVLEGVKYERHSCVCPGYVWQLCLVKKWRALNK